jgi:hypothetical protein
MNKKNNYANAPNDIAKEIESSIPVTDFLPSPDKIAAMLKRESAKIVMRSAD